MKKIYRQHFCCATACLTLFVILSVFSNAAIFGQKSPDTPRYRTLKYLVSKKDVKDLLKTPNTNSQNNSYVASLIPPTPEAASLGTYGNNPVSFGSGVASIPIPLYQIKQKDIGLDLSLSYHGGGVRLEEVAPWTGLGVSLVGLGTITRTVRGSKADELSNGFISIPYNLDNINDWYQDGSHPTEVNQFKNDYTATDPIDTEADLFNFNFGKYSGKYVYNKTDGVFYTVPRQNLKIEHNSDFSTWTIITEEGIKYVFGTSELTTSVVSNCSSSIIGAGTMANAPTAWHLTQIVSPTDPTNTITINYLPETISMTTNGSSKKYILVSGCGGATPFNNNCQTTVTTLSAKVSEIVFRNGKITFQRSVNNRCDIESSAKTLQKIILYDANNQRVKATKMYYSYFGSQQANDGFCGTSNFTGRLRLDSLKNFGVTDNDSLPPHILEYEPYAGILPSTRSYAQDHWGYYNGVTGNDNLIPQFRYQNPYNLKWEVIGSNIRETSPSTITFNQIKKITYPTGGRSEFEFEANRYYQATCDPNNCLNEEATTQQKTCIYDAGNGTYPIVTFTINQGAFCRNACQNGVLADFTAIGSLLGIGFDNVQFRLSSTNPAFTTIDISSQSFFTGFLPNGTYTLRGFYSGAYDPALDETYIRLTWKEAISSNIPVGGLRIKKITDYDGNANVVNLRNFQYHQEGSTHSSASIGTIPYYGEFTYFQGNSCIGSGILLSAESTYPLINTQGATVGYTRVEVSYGATGENGKSVHTFTPVSSFQTNYNFPTVAAFMQDWKEGLPLTNRQLSASNISLKSDSSHHEFNVSSSQSLFKFSTGLRLAVVPVDRLLDVYFINAYRTPTDWFFTDFMEDKTYHSNGSDAVKSPKWFQYNNMNFMPSLTKTVNSFGDTLKTEIKYPHDFSTDPIYAGMLLKNQSGMMIEQSDYVYKVGGTAYDFLMKKRNNFAKFNSTFYATNTVETQYGSGSLTQEVSFQYTNDALISSIMERNGIKTAFTWYGATDIGKRDLLKSMVKGDGSTIAQTTSYDYKPLVGMISQTDPRGLTSTFEYDALNRVQTLKDSEGKIVKNYSYQYASDTPVGGGTCTTPSPTITAVPASTSCNSVLTASTCAGGTINWSNGQTGTTITVPSVVSPVYTATCTTTCASPASNALAGLNLPLGWTPVEVGASLNGCLLLGNNQVTMRANATTNGIGGSTADSHYFYQKTFSGNVTIIAKISSMSSLGGVRVGLMFKGSTGASSKFFSIVQQGDVNNIVGKIYRETDNATANILQYTSATANVWLKIKKVGNVIQAYYSTASNPSISNDTGWIEDLSGAGLPTPPNITWGSSFVVGTTISNTSTTNPAEVIFTNVQIDDNGTIINP
jgi:RHS Repeat